MREIAVQRLHNPEQAYPFLGRDRVYSAYALGALEIEQWSCLTALMARDEQEAELGFSLLAQPVEAAMTLFLMGSPAAVEEILQHPMARSVYAWISAKEEHLACLTKYWRLDEPERMLRMTANRGSFRPPARNEGCGLRRLGPADGMALAEAYEVAFGTPAAARLLERGPYYGVWRAGRLISVAGTHLVSRGFRLACVGNVWTNPGHRGQGLATLTVGAVTAALLETCEEVVLNVREDNQSARRVYERLGYRAHCPFWQMRGRWRG